MRPSEVQPIRFFCKKCGKEIKEKLDYNLNENVSLNGFVCECNDCLSKTTEIILSQSEIDIIKNWAKNTHHGWSWDENNSDSVLNKIINIKDGRAHLTEMEILIIFSWSSSHSKYTLEEEKVILKLKSIINKSSEIVKRKEIRLVRFFCKKCGKEIDLDYKVNEEMSLKYFLEVCYCADCFDEKKIKKFRKLKDEEFSEFYLELKSKSDESDFLKSEEISQDVINRVTNNAAFFSDLQFKKIEDLLISEFPEDFKQIVPLLKLNRDLNINQSFLGEKFKKEIMRKRKEERKLEKEK